MDLWGGIWASQPEFGPRSWGGGTKEEKEKEEKEKEEKFALCESIGHQPLRGRCPKKDTF